MFCVDRQVTKQIQLKKKNNLSGWKKRSSISLDERFLSIAIFFVARHVCFSFLLRNLLPKFDRECYYEERVRKRTERIMGKETIEREWHWLVRVVKFRLCVRVQSPTKHWWLKSTSNARLETRSTLSCRSHACQLSQSLLWFIYRGLGSYLSSRIPMISNKTFRENLFHSCLLSVSLKALSRRSSCHASEWVKYSIVFGKTIKHVSPHFH